MTVGDLRQKLFQFDNDREVIIRLPDRIINRTDLDCDFPAGDVITDEESSAVFIVEGDKK